MENLKNTFCQLVRRYADDDAVTDTLWTEIERHYSEKRRHYHNLTHLAAMQSELEAEGVDLLNPEAILFALFYHDLVYDVRASDNELKSAEMARQRLMSLNVETACIERVCRHINATKKHEWSPDPDTNHLVDADLSILGKDSGAYRVYAAQIRKEYKIYPDFLYNPGRKKVLRHFLELPAIYKTVIFKAKYELQARKNLGWELAQL